MSVPMLSEDMLERFEELLRAHKAPLAELLRPGMSRLDMDRLSSAAELQLPDEAYVWWGWRDGAAPTDNERRRDFGPGILLSLEEAIDQRWTMRELAIGAASEGDGEDEWSDPDFWWRPEWLPIAVRGANAVCDCSVASGRPTPVRVVDYHADPESFAIVRASSFGEMVSWWIEALETGAYRYDHLADRWRRHESLLEPDRLNTRLV